ncbi:PREDICTED: uncharacterized protein LOC105360309 [Ceratosolen solmsi marchali]|uniref:Uncharacterized protein LOC105360309 n=1 Tax=Ceratosolen solmsi marchali TaxID=326594 RepID=A0AAJ6VLK9_9HYME|nr:PREDICTED: uncharacterized protein LOC105360309 [Ceratosolen solmsi marchali]
MPLSRRAASLWPLLLILIIAGGARAFSSRTPECTFPSRWEGTWFQSGVRQSIVISKNILSSKGNCLHNEGDKFLLVDEKSCYRCVVIHEKHSNVLQYKETYCQRRDSLSSLCSYITGDALLFSMFREEATSVPCPFHGPMTFTYNRGHGRCSSPQSNVDTCTDESRLLFRYQACPDVPGSESTVEELECLATWKEGSNRYLVGRLHNGHSLSNEDRYRCFVYERGGQNVAGLNRAAAAALGIASILDHEIASAAAGPIPEGSPEIYKVAQSGDATCNGLFSPLEGSRTMTLTKASSPGKCWFPTWLTGKTSLTWHTLDLTRSYTFHMSNASLHTARSNGSARSSETPDFLNLLGQDEHNVKILCNSVKVADVEQNVFMIVAHFTVGCQSGYMCMAFYKRDGHVVELQTGSTVSRAEEACSPPHYQQHSIPYVTLVTSSPEPRQCPYLGKFTVTGLNGHSQSKSPASSSRGKGYKSERVRHGQERKLEFDIQKRRGNNQYLIHEQSQRRVRSGVQQQRQLVDSQDPEETVEELLMKKKLSARRTGHPLIRGDNQSLFDRKYRTRREPKLEDFQADMDDFAQMHRSWGPRRVTDDSQDRNIEEVAEDNYFADYMEEVAEPLKTRVYPRFLSYADLLRLKRDAEREEREELDHRRKREESEEERPRCNSDITTLTVGCSTADRMEFQSDCVDEDFVTAYSCHGRWFDAEGTQFVIATPLARRNPASWNGPDGSRAQPYRNSRRLCFMYRENGGVVSLTASPVACQRGIPPPPPLLAFNATSIGQCMDGASSLRNQSIHLILSALILFLAAFR